MLPWELLWDAHGALLLISRQLAACVRYLDLDQALPPPAPSGSVLRILTIAPTAGIPVQMREEEHAALKAAWSSLANVSAVLEEMSPATPSTLVNRLQAGPPVDIVHFYGRGRYRDGHGALLFDSPGGGDIWLSADQLAVLFGAAQARLVLLHACQSALTDDSGLLTGVALALSTAGVPAVVAMQFTVRAAAATRFAEVVYRALARGDALQHAVSQARQALYVEELDWVSWHMPTLTIRARDTRPLRLVEPAGGSG
jgi:CHAT domain-containing protein